MEQKKMMVEKKRKTKTKQGGGEEERKGGKNEGGGGGNLREGRANGKKKPTSRFGFIPKCPKQPYHNWCIRGCRFTQIIREL